MMQYGNSNHDLIFLLLAASPQDQILARLLFHQQLRASDTRSSFTPCSQMRGGGRVISNYVRPCYPGRKGLIALLHPTPSPVLQCRFLITNISILASSSFFTEHDGVRSGIRWRGAVYVIRYSSDRCRGREIDCDAKMWRMRYTRRMSFCCQLLLNNDVACWYEWRGVLLLFGGIIPGFESFKDVFLERSQFVWSKVKPGNNRAKSEFRVHISHGYNQGGNKIITPQFNVQMSYFSKLNLNHITEH